MEKDTNSILYQKTGDKVLWGINSSAGFPNWAVDEDLETDYHYSESSAGITFRDIDIPAKETPRLESVIKECKEKVANMRRRLSEICGQDVEMVVWRKMDLQDKNISLKFDREKEPLLADIRCELDADIAGDILPGSLVKVHIDACFDHIIKYTFLDVLRNGTEGRKRYDHAMKTREGRYEEKKAMKGHVRYTIEDKETGEISYENTFYLSGIDEAKMVLPDSLRNEDNCFSNKLFKRGTVYKYSYGKFENGKKVKDNVLFFMYFEDKEIGNLIGKCMKDWIKDPVIQERMPILAPEGYEYMVKLVPSPKNDGTFLISVSNGISRDLYGRLLGYEELKEWERYRAEGLPTRLYMNKTKALGSNALIPGYVIISPVTRNVNVFPIPENTTWCTGALYAGIIHDEECPPALLAYVRSRIFNPLMKIPAEVYVIDNYVHFDIGKRLKKTLKEIRKNKDHVTVKVLTCCMNTFYLLVLADSKYDFGYPAIYQPKDELERQYLLRRISKECDFSVTDITHDEIILSLNMSYNEFVRQLGLRPGSLVTLDDENGRNDDGDVLVTTEYKLQDRSLKLKGMVLKETIGNKTIDRNASLIYLGCDKGRLVMAYQYDRFSQTDKPECCELMQLCIIRRIDRKSWLCCDDEGVLSLLNTNEEQSAIISNIDRLYKGSTRQLRVIGSSRGTISRNLTEYDFINIAAGFDYSGFLAKNIVQLEVPATHKDKHAFVHDLMVVLENDETLTEDELRIHDTMRKYIYYDKIVLRGVNENDEFVCKRLRQKKTVTNILRYNSRANSAPAIGCLCEGRVIGYGEYQDVLILNTPYGEVTIDNYDDMNIPEGLTLDSRTSGSEGEAIVRDNGYVYIDDLYPRNTKLRLVLKEFLSDDYPVWAVDPTLPAFMSEYRLIYEMYGMDDVKWVVRESTSKNLAVVSKMHVMNALRRSSTAVEIVPKRGDYVGLVSFNNHVAFFPRLDVETGLLERVLTLEVVGDAPDYFVCRQARSSDSIMTQRIYEKNPLTFRIRKNEWNWDGAELLDFAHFKNRVVKARVDSIDMEEGIVYMDRRSLIACHRDISTSQGHCIAAMVTGYDDEEQNVKLTYTLHSYDYNLTMSYSETDCLGLQIGLYDKAKSAEIIRELLPLGTIVTAKVITVDQRSVWQHYGNAVISQRQMHPDAHANLKNKIAREARTSMAIRSIGNKYIFVKREKVVFAIEKGRRPVSYSIGQSVTVRLDPRNRDYVCVIGF